jgi:hypothetical protein
MNLVQLVLLDSKNHSSLLVRRVMVRLFLRLEPDSGLDADLLDGAQGAYYLNASNMNSGILYPVDRLSGTYNISHFWSIR